MKKIVHIKKNRALLLLTKHSKNVKSQAKADETQLQSDKIRRVAKRITKSPYIRIDVENER